MNSPSEPTRAWARQLLAVESASHSPTQLHKAVRVSEKLRSALTRFVGADGFAALLRRALALAKADVPALENARVAPDGRLEGIEEIAADAGTSAEAAIAITAHLLALLVTFIGEPLTLRIVRGAWPDTSLEE
jgi:hypothetical protein